MRAVMLALLLGSVGCTEKAIDLRLAWPDAGSDVANMDVSCVNSVHVLVQGEIFEDFTSACVEVTNPTSYADLQAQIRGKLDSNLPDNPIAIEVRGQAGAITGNCGSGMNVFYAGANYTGDDTTTLRVEGSLDCSALAPGGTLAVRPIDFIALAKTPANTDPVCTTITGEATLDLGLIRPTNITAGEYPSSIMEYGDTIAPDGTGVVQFDAMGTPLPTSCLAASESLTMFSASCIYPSNPRICAQAGEVELPILRDTDSYVSIDNAYFADYPVIVLGIVYDSVTRRPVAGATVELGENRGAVVYAKPTNGPRMEPIDGATTTDASGVFVAYLYEPSVATVAQGASMKSMRIGGVTGWGSAVIVPLR